MTQCNKYKGNLFGFALIGKETSGSLKACSVISLTSRRWRCSVNAPNIRWCEMSAVFTCEAVEGGREGGGDDEKEVVVSVMRRMEGGGDGGGGRATGTQERGSKQGEALTSACLTLET